MTATTGPLTEENYRELARLLRVIKARAAARRECEQQEAAAARQAEHHSDDAGHESA